MSELRAKIEAAIAAKAKAKIEEEQRAEGILTHARLKELVAYDSDTGDFTRISGKNRGERAGYQNANGYVYVYVDGREYAAHRLAWFYTYGKWPDQDIDHKDRVKNNNRIGNLRDVSKSENLLNIGLNPNNTSGVRGVSYSKSRKKWCVYRNEGDKRIYVAAYDNLSDAADEAKKYYGKVD